MKKVIGGKKYDTDAAREVGRRGNCLDCNNDSFCEETLYRKKTGEYFLHGVGGSASKYGVQVGQGRWAGGEMIIPMLYESAEQWGKSNLDANDYESAFGEAPGEKGMVALNTTLSAAANDKLRRIASRRGESLKTVLEKLIMDA